MQGSGSTPLVPLVVIGGLITITPMGALFPLARRHRRGGLPLVGIAN